MKITRGIFLVLLYGLSHSVLAKQAVRHWVSFTKPDACILNYQVNHASLMSFFYFKDGYDQSQFKTQFTTNRKYVGIDPGWVAGKADSGPEYVAKSRELVDPFRNDDETRAKYPPGPEKVDYLETKDAKHLLHSLKAGYSGPVSISIDGKYQHLVFTDKDFKTEYQKFHDCIHK